MKSLKELALQISEEQYRENPALSYSLIATYEKGGFASIPHLYDKKESDALTFGSMVDTIITEGMEKFQEKFAVADFKIPTDSIKGVIDWLLEYRTEEYFEDIPDNVIIVTCDLKEYQMKYKPETRLSKVRSEGENYYNTIRQIGNRKVVSDEVYQEVLAVVGALKGHVQTSKYLQQTKEGSNIEFLYQQKFSTNLDGLDVRCMMDLIIVNHDRKIIIPIDLKTSSMLEYDFPKKYLENRYDLQSRLYCRILKNIIKDDEYFKDFKIGNFRFMVVNKNNRLPLIFVDEYSFVEGDIELKFKSGSKKILRNPVTIGKELRDYLNRESVVPTGIDIYGLNSIRERLELL
jgi:hypothetical protein